MHYFFDFGSASSSARQRRLTVSPFSASKNACSTYPAVLLRVSLCLLFFLFKDMYNQLYSAKSGADRGSLFQIRNAFQHRNVTSDVMKSFNHNADLLRFSTEGLASLLAMKLCNIQTLDETPEDYPDSTEDKARYLLTIARKVVNLVWEQVTTQDIKAVLDAEVDGDEEEDDYYEYCFCKAGKRSMQRPGTEAIRTPNAALNIKTGKTYITNSRNTKENSEQLFSERWPLSNL